MEFGSIGVWLAANWGGVIIAVVAFEAFMAAVAKLTPWDWDDNLVIALGKLVGLIKK